MSGSVAIHAAFIRGVEAIHVTVEMSMGGGLPGIQIVGMADAAVLEARQRIRCALRSAGFVIPRKNITVNLAPGNIRKIGTGFDLPIAIAILALTGQISISRLEQMLFIGELGLDGTVNGISGEVAYQSLARELNLILVGGWSNQHVPLGICEYRFLKHLSILQVGMPELPYEGTLPKKIKKAPTLDFRDVVGQDLAKRGLAIAATGELGLMMIGPPGAGKTMLAERLTTILPPIDQQRQQEVLRIYSVVGEKMDDVLQNKRPFRAPHHSISLAGLLGGGRPVHPGEISLAHAGVLYLDEFGEWPAHTLQALRQPMEEGAVRITRVDGLYKFPAAFQFVAASNPCPCGYLGDPEIACTCSAGAIDRYQARMAGPLMDRIDIKLMIRRPQAGAVLKGEEGLSTEQLRDQVIMGREFKAWRAQHTNVAASSNTGTGSILDRACLSESAAERVLMLAKHIHLSARGITRLCRIARTIADIDQKQSVLKDHIAEAILYFGRGE